MEGQNFCGVSVTPDCGEIEIQGIPALDFQLWFIDNLAELLSKSVHPKIVPKLFIADDVSEPHRRSDKAKVFYLRRSFQRVTKR